MGGMLPGAMLIPSGTESSPGLPYRISAYTGIFYPPNFGGFGISVAGKKQFTVHTTGFEFGFKPQQTFTLSNVSGSPFTAGANANDAIYSPDNLHVFSVGGATGNQLWVYSRDPVTYALTPIAGSPYTIPTASLTVCTSPTGSHVYVSNPNWDEITGFSRDDSTGALTAIGGSPFATAPDTTPQDIIVSPDGAHAYAVCTGSKTVCVFSRNQSSGALSRTGNSTALPASTGTRTINITPDGAHVIVCNALTAAALSVFARNALTGALTEVTGSPFFSTNEAHQFDISTDGAHVALTNLSSNTVQMFSRDPVTGNLTEVAGSPFATSVALPYIPRFMPSNDYLAISSYNQSKIAVYSRNINTGALTEVAGSPFSVGNAPYRMDFAPDNSNLIVANSATNAISEFNTGSTITYNLVTGIFDVLGGLNGKLNIYGALAINLSPVITRATGDARYGRLYGVSDYVGLSTGTSTAYVLTPGKPITSYTDGQKFLFKAHVANGASATFAISGLSALSATMGSVALPAGGLILNNYYWAFIEAGGTSIRISPLDAVSSNGDTINGQINFLYGYAVAGAAKVISNLGAGTTQTIPAGQQYTYFITSGASMATTFPAAAAAIDGLKMTVVSQTAVATATWISSGASFIGAPGAFVANTPVRMIYDHATLSWYPA